MSGPPAGGDEHPKEKAASHDSASSASPRVVRGLRVMAVVRWALLALVTLIAARTMWTFWGPSKTDHASHEEARFYCPMHPQIRSADPGECPICHMNLEPIPAERRADTPTASAPASNASTPSGVVTVSVSAEKQRAVGLTTSEVTSDSLGSSLRVPGVVSAPETGLAQVRVRATGFVERVAVSQTGVRVARGQTLAWIYSPEIYRAEEEFLAATRWNAAPSPSAVPTSGAGDLVVAARRGLELLGLNGADIDELVRTGQPTRAVPVRAPSPGYVTRFNAVLGSRADPETVLYELANLSTVWVIASVHERDMASVLVGTAAHFAAAGQVSIAVEARVELVEPELDTSTRTSRVRLALENRDFLLRPGQFGDVTFALPEAQGLFVPRDAVIHTGEQQYVYLAGNNDQFEPRAVRTGIEADGRIQVLEGLAAGQRVVTRGSFMLDSESRLQSSLAEAPRLATSPIAAPTAGAPLTTGAR